MRTTSRIGNSLAYLLSQKHADVHVVSKKTGRVGNSLAYLLSHMQ